MTTLSTSTGSDQASRLRSLVRALRSEPAAQVEAQGQPTSAQVIEVVANEPRAPQRPRSHVLAIASGKGGVGKTVVAVNLAVELARIGRSVTLVDADLGAANADIMLGARPRRRLDAALASPQQLRELITETDHGLRLLAGAVGTRRMVERADALYRRLSELDGLGDLIIVDLPAGLDSFVIETCAQADQTLIVTTPEPTAIADAYATIKAVTARRAASECTPTQRLEVVLNQSATEEIARRAHERLATVAQRFLARRVALAGFLASDPLVVRSIAARCPLICGRSCGAWNERIRALAVRVQETIGATNAPMLGV